MRNVPRASAIMDRNPMVLSPETLVRDATRLLFRSRMRGAAVVDADRRFLGVFSDHGLMVALVHTLHHELPAGTVGQHLDPPPPVLHEDTNLLTIAHLFAETGEAHALLPVLAGERLVGTVTRVDVARALAVAIAAAADPDAAVNYFSARPERPPFDARGPWG